ncbi:MAG: GGDEF domain-containing protein [Alphaproteobacteria bacterium]
MFLFYGVFGIQIRHSELAIGFLCPAIIAPSISWLFIDLLKRLDSLEKEMRWAATYDRLTGVLTRGEFFKEAERCRAKLANTACNINACTMLMIDLDHFKQINDTYGHLAGDFVLEGFGKMLNSQRAFGGVAGRYGGEEFVMLLCGYDQEQAEQHAQKLIEATRNTVFAYEKQPIKVTISIGISSTVSEPTQVKQLIRQADQALYEAKGAGRDRFVKYSDILQECRIQPLAAPASITLS